jgi:hypothetical protein
VKSFNSRLIAIGIASIAVTTLSSSFTPLHNSERASAHAGGLDSNGCHSGLQPYHCHRAYSGTPNNTTDTSTTIAETPTVSAISPPLKSPQNSITPSTSPPSKTASFKNCTAVKKAHPNGVAKSKSAAKKQKKTPTVSSKIYSANKKLDRDNDGTICEN